MKNFYSILGVTPDSSNADIKSAYRRLARKYHPDVNPDGSEMFKEILQAYETLSDAKKRLHYDTLNGYFKSFRQAETQDDIKNAKTEPKKKEKEDFSKKINELFEEFGKKQNSKPIPKRGSNIYEEISISLEDSIHGCERKVNVMHTFACEKCKGRKFINGSKCSVCNGTGEMSEHKKITVKIPKNIKNGAKLRIPNEGNAGENGGKNGDLFLNIKIEPNNNMSYDGNNIICNLAITPFEAVLGASVSVGINNLSLRIPAKTHSGQKFRLAGQGLNQNGKSGDMIVKVYIEIPSSLSDDEVKLYEKLRKLSAKDIRENL